MEFRHVILFGQDMKKFTGFYFALKSIQGTIYWKRQTCALAGIKGPERGIGAMHKTHRSSLKEIRRAIRAGTTQDFMLFTSDWNNLG